MITIKVGDTPLYIPKETTLVLEQHNNSFDIDNLTSDIIWTFDVPAAPNAIALNNAHFVYISNFKRYRCTIIFNGIVISNGYLFVQSVVNEKKISCGVVLDGLGEEFANRKLKDNNYGDDVVISQLTDSLETHRANWLSFLQGSLANDSIYKFFLFACEKFYKNNDAYGWHRNKRATLRTDHDEKFWCEYVNRLFIYYDTSLSSIGVPTVGNLPDTSEYGIKVFNTLGNVGEKLNGFAFAPAIRLDWLVEKVLANAGYRVTGDFLSNEHIKKLYLQSMNAMDGDLTQFGLDEFLYITNASGVDNIATAHSMDVGINEVSYDGFRCGSETPIVNFRLDADVDSLVTGQTASPTAWQPWQYIDEVFLLIIRTPNAVAEEKYPVFRSVVSNSAAKKDYIYGVRPYNFGVAYNKFVFRQNNTVEFYNLTAARWETHDYIVPTNDLYAIQLTTSTGDATASYDDPEQAVDILGSFSATRLRQQSGGVNFVVELAKFRVKTVEHGTWDGNPDSINTDFWIPDNYPNSGTVRKARVEKYGNYERLEYLSTVDKTELANTNTMMNVFDTMLRWKQHVPNVSNGEFLKKICKFFGLSMYVNPFHKVVQLSFANNLFSAKATDISEYVISTERMTYEPKQYHVTVDTVLGTKGVAEDFLMDDVTKRADLDTARSKKRMSVFVANENAYNIATMDDKTGKFSWETSAGNDKRMVVGNEGDDIEDVGTGILVPNMRVVDSQGLAEYLCDIASSGNSKLTDDDYTGEFDMILQQYKGERFMIRVGSRAYFIEDANPTCMNKNGDINENYIDLAAVGKNAVGEKWLRKLYEFKATQERYRFVAKLPVQVFLSIYQMQMPQEESKGSDTRWIMVRNRKYMPLTISYEFGANDKVLATIECARMHY